MKYQITIMATEGGGMFLAPTLLCQESCKLWFFKIKKHSKLGGFFIHSAASLNTD